MHLPFRLHSQMKLIYHIMLPSGDKRTLGFLLCLLFGVSLALVSSGIAPAFTEDVARSVNVSIFLCHTASCWVHFKIGVPLNFLLMTRGAGIPICEKCIL